MIRPDCYLLRGIARLMGLSDWRIGGIEGRVECHDLIDTVAFHRALAYERALQLVYIFRTAPSAVTLVTNYSSNRIAEVQPTERGRKRVP